MLGTDAVHTAHSLCVPCTHAGKWEADGSTTLKTCNPDEKKYVTDKGPHQLVADTKEVRPPLGHLPAGAQQHGHTPGARPPGLLACVAHRSPLGRAPSLPLGRSFSPTMCSSRPPTSAGPPAGTRTCWPQMTRWAGATAAAVPAHAWHPALCVQPAAAPDWSLDGLPPLSARLQVHWFSIINSLMIVLFLRWAQRQSV